MKNARFWHWSTGHSDGWVKLTLPPGQTLRWSEFHRTDEGHSFQTCTWTHNGPEVTRSWSHGGRDCDGRIETTGTDSCPLDKLHDCQPVTGDDPNHPDWQEAEQTTVNDESARLANY